MIATCIGYDEHGYKREYGVDTFVAYDVVKDIDIEDPNVFDDDLGGELGPMFYSSVNRDDTVFNAVRFVFSYDNDHARRPLIVHTAGVVYMMGEDGKTFAVIGKRPRQ